mgnify:CR=1 FL=1
MESIFIKAKSNNIKINKSREFESINMVVDNIYSLVVKTFKLNSANRADKVISLIDKNNHLLIIKGESLILKRMVSDEVLIKGNIKSIEM